MNVFSTLRNFPIRSVLLSTLIFSQSVRAEVELPIGSIGGCPFIHEDAYDLAPILETLKAQLSTELNNRNKCKQSIQAIVSNLTPLQDFYKTLDPTTRQRITQQAYQDALNALNGRKIQLELAGDTSSTEYLTVISRIGTIEDSNLLNSIDLQTTQALSSQGIRADYRNQLLTYTSNVLNAYNDTARNHPECISSMGGWSTALSTVLGGFSIATGLGINPAAWVIGAAIGTGVQLVTLLQDSKVRASYNDLTRLKNYKTLACTYYSLKKASCEYQRAYLISQDTGKIRAFLRNRFGAGSEGEYERFFVNQGRIKFLGDLFALISQMGSPLTLDQTLLSSYLTAKAVDFKNLGDAPPATATDDVIKSWLLRARSFGVSYSEISIQTGSAIAVPLRDQLKNAIDDITSKLGTIASAEKLIRSNLSFLDLKRKIESDFPKANRYVLEMAKYLNLRRDSGLISNQEKGTIDGAITLLTLLNDFLDVAVENKGIKNATYEEDIVNKGGMIFEELAKGSVAQLNRQSVLTLSSKGTDRLGWAFGVIRNSYLNRDQEQNLPRADRFSEFQKNRNILSDVVGNYEVFAGPGTAFRNEEFSKSLSIFENSFKKEMLRSLDFAMTNQKGLPELKGQTAAHLCALYYPSLKNLSRSGVFGDNQAAEILKACQDTYKTLKMNLLVADEDFKIDYGNDCTYFQYTREMDIQNLLANLIRE
jgi:hypothetical protein